LTNCYTNNGISQTKVKNKSRNIFNIIVYG
jgi:hypothetical protein